jgi:hypothetical protein
MRRALRVLNGDIDADLIPIDKPRAGPARHVAVSPAPSFRAGADGEGAAAQLEPGSERSERQRVVAALEQADRVQACGKRLVEE